MIARVGNRARATADADATWRIGRSQLGGMLDRAAGLDLADYFEFIIGQGRPIQGEGAEGGVRFPLAARLASEMFGVRDPRQSVRRPSQVLAASARRRRTGQHLERRHLDVELKRRNENAFIERLSYPVSELAMSCSAGSASGRWLRWRRVDLPGQMASWRVPQARADRTGFGWGQGAHPEVAAGDLSVTPVIAAAMRGFE